MSNELIPVKQIVCAALGGLVSDDSTAEVQLLIAQALLRDKAQEELKKRMDHVATVRTPPNVLEDRVVGKTERGDKVHATYVKLGYMQELARTYISADIQFRSIVPPHLVEMKNPGYTRVIPTFTTYMEMDIHIYGQLISTIPCSGACQVKKGENGIEMAEKGCVTDAMKKGYSLLKICPDVYKYGDVVALDSELVVMYFNQLLQDYDNVVPTTETMNFLSGAQTVDSLRARYWACVDKFKKAKAKEEDANAIRKAKAETDAD